MMKITLMLKIMETANAAIMTSILTMSFSFVMPLPISQTTDAITAPTPACMPSSIRAISVMERNAS